MIRSIAWLLAGLLAAHASWAQSTTEPVSAEKAALAQKLSAELQLPQLLDAVRKETEASVKLQVEGMMAQLAKSGVPDQLLTDIRPQFDVLMSNVLASWDTDEAARIYSSALFRDMTAKDLQAAIDFYATSSGAASYNATLAAAKQMNQYIMASISKSMNDQMAVMMPQVIAKARAAARAKAHDPQ